MTDVINEAWSAFNIDQYDLTNLEERASAAKAMALLLAKYSDNRVKTPVF